MQSKVRIQGGQIRSECTLSRGTCPWITFWVLDDTFLTRSLAKRLWPQSQGDRLHHRFKFLSCSGMSACWSIFCSILESVEFVRVMNITGRHLVTYGPFHCPCMVSLTPLEHVNSDTRLAFSVSGGTRQVNSGLAVVCRLQH